MAAIASLIQSFMGSGGIKLPTAGGQVASSNGSGSSTTQQNLTPYQESLQTPLQSYLVSMLTNPAAIAAPLQDQARNQVNDNFTGVADNLRQQFLSTGGGDSGKYGQAVASSNLQRLGDLDDADLGVLNGVLGLQSGAASEAGQQVGLNEGSSTSGTSTTGGTQLQTTGPTLQDVMTALSNAGFGDRTDA